jgi:hypothetical protein
MSEHTPIVDGPFATSDALQQRHSALLLFVRLDIDDIDARQTVVRDEHRLFFALDFVKKLSGSALESCHQFGPHEVILKYHSRLGK